MKRQLNIHTLRKADYEQTHKAMLDKTLARIIEKKKNDQCDDSMVIDDELWVVDHQDVYTLGLAGKESHILARNSTPVIKTDRGGQVTWHGQGQLVMYWLFDLNKLNWKVRELVSHAEQAIEDVMNHYLKINNETSNFFGYYAKARQDAPGVYIYDEKDTMMGKIASLGFKIKQGFSYHGIAINFDCDLKAFNLINPCGYAGMKMVRLVDFCDYEITLDEMTEMIIENIKLRHSNSTRLRDW